MAHSNIDLLEIKCLSMNWNFEIIKCLIELFFPNFVDPNEEKNHYFVYGASQPFSKSPQCALNIIIIIIIIIISQTAVTIEHIFKSRKERKRSILN